MFQRKIKKVTNASVEGKGLEVVTLDGNTDIKDLKYRVRVAYTPNGYVIRSASVFDPSVPLSSQEYSPITLGKNDSESLIKIAKKFSEQAASLERFLSVTQYQASVLANQLMFGNAAQKKKVEAMLYAESQRRTFGS